VLCIPCLPNCYSLWRVGWGEYYVDGRKSVHVFAETAILWVAFGVKGCETLCCSLCTRPWDHMAGIDP